MLFIFFNSLLKPFFFIYSFSFSDYYRNFNQFNIQKSELYKKSILLLDILRMLEEFNHLPFCLSNFIVMNFY